MVIILASIMGGNLLSLAGKASVASVVDTVDGVLYELV